MNKSARAPSQPQWIEILRALMNSQGLNPRSLSLKAGLGATAVRDMLEGRARFPRYDTATALAKALGVTAAQLMGETVVDTSHTPPEPEQPDEIDLLTDVLAALHRAVQDRKTQLEPRELAAMATSVLRAATPDEDGKKPSASKISSHIAQLIDYETLRRGRKNG